MKSFSITVNTNNPQYLVDVLQEVARQLGSARARLANMSVDDTIEILSPEESAEQIAELTRHA